MSNDTEAKPKGHLPRLSLSLPLKGPCSIGSFQQDPVIDLSWLTALHNSTWLARLQSVKNKILTHIIIIIMFKKENNPVVNKEKGLAVYNSDKK